MKTRDYVIDMKVFNSVPQEEIQLMFPLETLENGKIPIGLHQLVLNTTEQKLDAFLESTFTHSDIKVLGIHYLNI